MNKLKHFSLVAVLLISGCFSEDHASSLEKQLSNDMSSFEQSVQPFNNRLEEIDLRTTYLEDDLQQLTLLVEKGEQEQETLGVEQNTVDSLLHQITEYELEATIQKDLVDSTETELLEITSAAEQLHQKIIDHTDLSEASKDRLKVEYNLFSATANDYLSSLTSIQQSLTSQASYFELVQLDVNEIEKSLTALNDTLSNYQQLIDGLTEAKDSLVLIPGAAGEKGPQGIQGLIGETGDKGLSWTAATQYELVQKIVINKAYIHSVNPNPSPEVNFDEYLSLINTFKYNLVTTNNLLEKMEVNE